MPPIMPTSHLQRVIGPLVVVVTITGCSMLMPDPEPLAGGRRWVITVDNQSAQPASLLVAVDGAPGPGTNIGPTVGRASPSTVPPHAVMEVTFDVPAGAFRAPTGETFAIFVNPDQAGMGPLILGTDVPPDAAGTLPIEIIIQRDGTPVMKSTGDLPAGWFGQ